MIKSILASLLLLTLFACQDATDLKNNPKIISNLKLQTYKSCSEVNQDLREASLNSMREQLNERKKYLPHNWRGGCAPGAAPAMDMAAPPPPQEGIDFSGTNNQEKGIDEADIIKLDGKYLYVLKGSKLEILAIPTIGGLEKRSSLVLEKPGKNLLILDNIAVITHDNEYGTPFNVSLIALGDDRSFPYVYEKRHFEGEIKAARKIKNIVYFASYQEKNVPGVELWPYIEDEGFWDRTEEEKKAIWENIIENTIRQNEEIINSFDFTSLVPNQVSLVDGEYQRQAIGEDDCQKIYNTKGAKTLGFVNIISIEPRDPQVNTESKINKEWILSNNPIVYASYDQLIIASQQNKNTHIHRFDISEDSSTRYNSSTSIPGHLHNSFSLSIHDGYLRVATSTDEANNLYILGNTHDGFRVISSIENIAPGERIWSARFSGEKGFLVTFRQVDPLFTLDLKDPYNPKIVGELKVPGVSTYLQDIGNDNILAIGYSGNENGLDWKPTISLFDVSDYQNPILASTISFGPEGLDRYDIESEANQDHLAINYFGPTGLTAIPITTRSWTGYPYYGSGEWEFRYASKLVLVNTKIGEPLAILGEIDHTKFAIKQNSTGFQFSDARIRRSYFYGDYIYAISQKGVTVTRISDMTETAAVDL